MVYGAISAERPKHQTQENVYPQGEPTPRDAGSEVRFRAQERPTRFQAGKIKSGVVQECIFTSPHVHGHALSFDLVHSILCPNSFIAHDAGFSRARFHHAVRRGLPAWLLSEEREGGSENPSQTD
jgi:hypothetical protein